MSWADLDLVQRTLILRAETAKLKKGWVIPLRDPMVVTPAGAPRDPQAEILGRDLNDTDPVFSTPEAAVWMKPTNNAMRLFDRLLVRAGIPRVDGEGCKLDARHPLLAGHSRVPAEEAPVRLPARARGPVLVGRASLPRQPAASSCGRIHVLDRDGNGVLKVLPLRRDN